jgi:hypothetical protein
MDAIVNTIKIQSNIINKRLDPLKARIELNPKLKKNNYICKTILNTYEY